MDDGNGAGTGMLDVIPWSPERDQRLPAPPRNGAITWAQAWGTFGPGLGLRRRALH